MTGETLVLLDGHGSGTPRKSGDCTVDASYGPSQQHLHLDGPMQWDEMELHLALDELVKAESCPSPGPAPSAVPAAHPVLGSGGAPNALDPGPKLQHAAPGYPPPTPGLSSATWDEQSVDESGGGRGKARRGPRPRMFKKNTCQADNCTADLGACSFYYQRNHICPAHLKAGAYAVRGVSTRFCQRCGVGHPVEDFSGAKRSCKKALDRHNQRRREKQGGSEGGQTGEDTGGPSQSRATPHASHANLAACSAMHPAPPACQPDAGADWEASSRFGGGAYAAAQPWNLPPDLLPLLGMSPPEGAVYGGAGPGAAAPAQGTSAGEVAHLQHWLAAGQGWGEFPQQAAQQAWQQPQDASGESGAFMHPAAPPPAPSSLYAALGEPSLSVGSVAMPTLDPGMLSMAPMPPEQLSWLSSQL
ncbi:hypothetical protein ACKKBG_A02735 [Auxenochlorella protothecoides x Auxenochlorella symbiontica]|uniref:SBP-type domain-containing protein n=1 Tax=Auxenochlorella protothecoides TaxID=3075 RepID=A0A1D1ZQC1_AUXPR